MDDKRKIAGSWKAGQSGNPKGKPKGTTNKITNLTRAKVNDILVNNWDRIQADLDSLDPKDRLNFLEKMMSYTLPKLQLIKADTTVRSTGAEGLTTTELTQFILQVANPNNHNDIGDEPESDPIPI